MSIKCVSSEFHSRSRAVRYWHRFLRGWLTRITPVQQITFTKSLVKHNWMGATYVTTKLPSYLTKTIALCSLTPPTSKRVWRELLCRDITLLIQVRINDINLNSASRSHRENDKRLRNLNVTCHITIQDYRGTLRRGGTVSRGEFTLHLSHVNRGRMPFLNASALTAFNWPHVETYRDVLFHDKYCHFRFSQGNAPSCWKFELSLNNVTAVWRTVHELRNWDVCFEYRDFCIP